MMTRVSVTRDATGGDMGDDEPRAWLTYAEAGRVLGVQPGSAKRLSFRRHWPRRMGNDGLARVGVPASALHRVSGDDTGAVTSVGTRDIPGDDTGDVPKDDTKGGTGPDRDKSPVIAEALAVELAHVRVQLATREGELVGLREALQVAEAGTREAMQRADRAERAALDAWHITADLARMLAQAKATDVPTRVAQPRWRWLARLLG